MDSQQAAALAATADAAVAASTDDYALQAAIAQKRPDLHIALETNPYLYEDLRRWFDTVHRRDSLPASAGGGLAAALASEAKVISTPRTALSGGAEVPVAQPVSVASSASTAPGAERTSRAPWAWGALALVAVLAVGAGVATFVLRGSGDVPAASAQGASEQEQAQPASVTVCDTAPTASVTSLSDAGGAGSIHMSLAVTPACEGGDILAGTTHLSVGQGGQAFVSGDLTFDTPVGVPADGLTLNVELARDSVYASNRELTTADTVTIEPDRAAAPQSLEDVPSVAQATLTSTMDAATADAAALAALQRQADSDAEVVRGSLNGSWVPQISSKRVGLVLYGETWDNRRILQHYRETLAQYPEAVLLYSDYWSVFDAGGHWWVIVVNHTYTDASGANSWCDSEGIGREDCFAKYLQEGAPSKGTTVQR